MADKNKINYLSDDIIDKVFSENTSDPISYGGIANGGTTVKTLLNPLGQKCFGTLAWSVDGTNYYPMQAYTSASAPYTANISVNNSTIFFYLENFSGSTQNFWIIYALDTIE